MLDFPCFPVPLYAEDSTELSVDGLGDTPCIKEGVSDPVLVVGWLVLLWCVALLEGGGGRLMSSCFSSSSSIASRALGLFSSPSSEVEPDLPRTMVEVDLEAPLPDDLEAVGDSG